MRLRVFRWALSVVVVVTAAVAGERAASVQAVPQSSSGTAGQASKPANPYESTYQPRPSRTTVIRNATILTAAGPVIERGAILLQDGKRDGCRADRQRAGRRGRRSTPPASG